MDRNAGIAGPMKSMGPGGLQAWSIPQDLLKAIIKKMNELFSGNLSEADFKDYVPR